MRVPVRLGVATTIAMVVSVCFAGSVVEVDDRLGAAADLLLGHLGGETASCPPDLAVVGFADQAVCAKTGLTFKKLKRSVTDWTESVEDGPIRSLEPFWPRIEGRRTHTLAIGNQLATVVYDKDAALVAVIPSHPCLNESSGWPRLAPGRGGISQSDALRTVDAVPLPTTGKGQVTFQLWVDSRGAVKDACLVSRTGTRSGLDLDRLLRTIKEFRLPPSGTDSSFLYTYRWKGAFVAVP